MGLVENKIKKITILGSDDGTAGKVKFELFSPLRPKKISSTWFPQLYEDGFNKKGDKLLEFWGLSVGEPFNNFYSVRGQVAEDLVVNMLKAKGFKPKVYKDTYDIFNYNVLDKKPMNKLYKYFGGLPDIVYRKDKDTIKLLEVKAKDLSKEEYILKSPPKYEIEQGKHLALLYGLDKVTMTYVLFDDNVMRNMQLSVSEPFDLKQSLEDFYKTQPKMEYGKHYKVILKEYNLDKSDLLERMKTSYKYAEGFRQTLTLSLSELSNETISEIFALERKIENGFE